MTTARKKLIEVSIPLEAINRESAREKSIRHGHPSTLHLWWARRPLAACRAVLFAQFVDDPSACPDEFPTAELQKAERDRLHNLIERLIPWDASANEMILTEARYEIARSLARGRGETLAPLATMKPQEIIDYLQANAPAVYDPFSGGGSIPLEAQRLGLKAMGSDLNPVAALIGKALIEFPPRFAGLKPVNPDVNELHQWKGAQGLAEDVRYYGRWMRAEAEKKIGHLYPKVKLKDGKEATVIAWLWARTVPSPDPRAKGARVPLASSFIVSAKAGKEVIVTPVVNRAKMEWHFEIDDKPSAEALKVAKNGTKAARGANFVCLLTGAAIDDRHVKGEATANRMSAALMAMVVESSSGRKYLPPTTDQSERVASILAPDASNLDQSFPEDARAFTPYLYGLTTFKSLYTPRQLIALSTFAGLATEARELVLSRARQNWFGAGARDDRGLSLGGGGPVAYADAVATYLAFAVDKAAVRNTTLCAWESRMDRMGHTFGRQALSMVWDYVETNPLAGAGGDIAGTATAVYEVLERLSGNIVGQIDAVPAQNVTYPDNLVISTDPPYYDNIPYADLSDFFYVWLRSALGTIFPDLFRRLAVPKNEELVATSYRHGGKDGAEAFFMEGMRIALARIANATNHTPTAIYYAFKQSEAKEDGITSAGWATFLQAVCDSGFSVDGTWPLRSELPSRRRGQASNALASSIVLVCRHREATASIITRADFLRALRREMPAALLEIRRAGIGPTDIQQAAIGPGIGIFTRHAQVLNTDGTPLLVKDALKLVNQVREEITSTGDAIYDSETRFALDWFAAKGFNKGKSGDAILMTNAVDVSLDGMNAAGVFEARGGDARLLKREELSNNWDPSGDNRATVWEACQHLIKRLTAEDGGIDAAAALYNRLGGLAEPAHALARRLYDICEQKQWASEGRVYNQLHQEWAVIEKRAAELTETRADLFSN